MLQESISTNNIGMMVYILNPSYTKDIVRRRAVQG
jgi:hypothetical protein